MDEELDKEYKVLTMRSGNIIAHINPKEKIQIELGIAISCKEHCQAVDPASNCNNCIQITISNQLPNGMSQHVFYKLIVDICNMILMK